jgi:hypothetical protein
LYASVAISLCPLILSIQYFSIVGAFITISLIGQALFIRTTVSN